MSTFLITGTAGFIGSHLAERLLAQGHVVVGLDNFDAFYDPAVKRANIGRALQNMNFTLVEGDIRDGDLVAQVLRDSRVNTVIHLAARAGVRPSIEEPLLYEDVNVRGTLAVLQAMRETGVSRMLFASSSSVYGNRERVPFAETDSVDHPVSPYAATKKAGELLAYTFSHLYGMNIWCLRFFTVYGPRQRPEMAIAKFLRAARNGSTVTVFGDGSMQRDFTYINDIIDGVTRALDHIDGYEIVNIGGAHAYPLTRLLDLIEEVTGVTLERLHEPVPAGDVKQTVADTRRAKDLFGYEPKWSLKDGIQAQWEWMEKSDEG
ncbi:MAG: NAD-dependent epimerase/dehydratase family protein [Chlorobi bacterium]|nr:NAD-dependent epimerase/dehydratase family protein [Chlorobiota bacterium]